MRSENIINRKIIIFYIEAIPNFFSQLRQKIFFRGPKKIDQHFSIQDFSVEKIDLKIFENRKFEIFVFFCRIFLDLEKIFFVGVEKFLGV